MTLSKEQIAARDGRLTASRVACLMGDDKIAIHNLWRELIGDPTFKPEDLSRVWPVQLGSATENLHLNWIEYKRGKVSRRGEVVQHQNGWAAATLDGWLDSHECPIECKHVGGFEKFAQVRDRYYPQMTWQMIVTGANQCLFSVIEGAREPIGEFILFDKPYADELWKRAEAFMDCVQRLVPPVALDLVAPPRNPDKEYDYSKNNSWVSAAFDWVSTKEAAEKNEEAKETLKGLTPKDATKVFGGGVEIVRDKANRLRLTEK